MSQKNNKYHTVGTVKKSTEKEQIPHRQNSYINKQKNNEYHTVGIVLKSNRKITNTTLSE
jgi:hypothetical protein